MGPFLDRGVDEGDLQLVAVVVDEVLEVQLRSADEFLQVEGLLLRLAHVVDVELDLLLVAADRREQEGGQEFGVEVVFNDLGSADLHQLRTTLEEHDHSLHALERLGGRQVPAAHRQLDVYHMLVPVLYGQRDVRHLDHIDRVRSRHPALALRLLIYD